MHFIIIKNYIIYNFPTDFQSVMCSGHLTHFKDFTLLFSSYLLTLGLEVYLIIGPNYGELSFGQLKNMNFCSEVCKIRLINLKRKAKIEFLILILGKEHGYYHLKIIQVYKLVEYSIFFLLVLMDFWLNGSFMMIFPAIHKLRFLFIEVDFSTLCIVFLVYNKSYQIFSFLFLISLGCLSLGSLSLR